MMAKNLNKSAPSNSEKCRLCYNKFVKLDTHMLKKHADELYDEIDKVNGHFCSDVKLDLPEGTVEPNTSICQIQWKDGTIYYVSALKISTLPKFRDYVKSINSDKCPNFLSINANDFLRGIPATCYGDDSIKHVEKRQRSRTTSTANTTKKGEKRTRPEATASSSSAAATTSAEDDCQVIGYSQSPYAQTPARSSNTDYLKDLSLFEIRKQQIVSDISHDNPAIRDLLNCANVKSSPSQQEKPPPLIIPFTFPNGFNFSGFDNSAAVNPSATNGRSGLGVPVNSSSVIDVTNHVALSHPCATANITLSATPFNHFANPQQGCPGSRIPCPGIPDPGHFSGIFLPDRNPGFYNTFMNVFLTGGTKTNYINFKNPGSRIPESRTKSSGIPCPGIPDRTKKSVPDSPDPQSSNENVNTQGNSPTVQGHRRRRKDPSSERPAPPSNQQLLPTPSPNASSSTTISTNRSSSTPQEPQSLLNQLAALLNDPLRPIIIDDDSLHDLRHVLIGDYNKHKQAAALLSLFSPRNPITFTKCQKLHTYIENGGTPINYFFLDPSLDTVRKIFTNGFHLFHHEIQNRNNSNPLIKIENEQCFGHVYQYITWWKNEMAKITHLICSNYMTQSGNQEVPIRAFSSNVACYPFSPTFKMINFSFSKFNHRITRPIVLSGTNIGVKSLLMIFVGQYGNVSPDDNLEIQPTRFDQNLNEVFSALKVYDANENEISELRSYPNLDNCIFLYQFPDKINTDSDISIRFSVDFGNFGEIADGYCMFGQIVNSLSVNH